MDQRLAEDLSRQLKISLEQVVREEYELLILQKLLDSPLGGSRSIQRRYCSTLGFRLTPLL